MDNLTSNAMLAKAAGMSYGQWKALQPPQEPKEKELPEGWVKCEYCGKPFKKQHGKRFCDIVCRQENYESRAKVMREDYYLRCKKKGDEHGKVY